jgi:flagellar basal body rod protein FlgG
VARRLQGKLAVMNVSLTQAAAAMNASAQWQDVIAQNLSAGSVPGFKKQDISFESIAAGQMQNTPMPSAHISTNFQQGEIRPTGVPTDVAIEGDGFFEVQLPNGGSAYTRDGEFQVNSQGEIVTKQGYPVLTDGGPIQVDSNNAAPISISSDGTVSQGADSKGKLKITAFSNPELLAPAGYGQYQANNPHLQSSPVTSPSVRQGYLEAGNVSTVTEMANLITAMRQYEANQKVVQTQDDRMGRAITELGNPNPS